MNILLASSQTPFIGGGARYHQEGLLRALRAAGHNAESVRLPFRYDSIAHTRELMRFAESIDLSRPNGQAVDVFISLQFPAWGIHHPDHRIWLMHQHRASYELFDSAGASGEERSLRDAVQAFDRAAFERSTRLYANSPRVAERLVASLGIASTPLLHPPPLAEHFHCAQARAYLFYPSRFETLKRQDLLIRAMRLVRAPVSLLLAGTGGQEARCRRLAEEEGVADRVRFLGDISDGEKIAFYAHCLAVPFVPEDEDYGYVTLEAMLSSKPVLTCSDSGGPLSFVEHGVTGLVAPPEADALADAIDGLAGDPDSAAHMGIRGREAYETLALSWDVVVGELLG